MITITKNEEVVLKQVEIYSIEYPEGVPVHVLRKELGFHEYDLVEILKELNEKKFIIFKNNSAIFSENKKEFNIVNSRDDLKEIELDLKEKESYDLIDKLVDKNNVVSKYSLEGHMLYGDLKLSNFRMYHIILSLQNKGFLKSIDKEDGEYYLLVK